MMDSSLIHSETSALSPRRQPGGAAEEALRRAALEQHDILDTPPDARFDAVARSAAAIAGTAVALISLADADRYWFKACIGLTGMTEVPRAIAFCESTIAGIDPLVVDDLLQDVRFSANPLVKEAPFVRFYAGFPLHDSAGVVLGALCVLDVAPRHLDAGQMAALRELALLAMALITKHHEDSEMRLLRAFSDMAPAQIYVCRPRDLRLVYANAAGLARIDPDAKLARQLMGRVSLADLQTWMSPDSLRQVIAEAIANAPRPTLLQVHQPGDPVTDLQMRVAPFAHEGRDLIGVALTNISEWKQAERAHSAEMERWRVAIEQSGDGLWDWSVKTGGVFFSAGWPALLGLAYDEVEPCYGEWLSRIHPDDASRAAEDMARCFRSPEGSLESEVRMRCKDGSYTWILHRGRVVERDDAGTPARLVGVAMSTAARRELVESLQTLNTELESRVTERTRDLDVRNQDLRLFSGAVAHDLAAPLRAIRGYASLLQIDHAAELSSDGRVLLAQVEAGARRMHLLLEALLGFFLVSEKAVRFETVDANAAVQAVLEMHAGSIAARPNLRIEVAKMPPMQGDPALLQNIFAILIANSLKFTRDHASALIEVGSLEFDRRPAYFVQDNGVGFDPQFSDQLFKPLARLQHHGDFEGTGLGLATAARILERSGGRIWAEGAVDVGAAFVFQFGSDAVPQT